MFMIVYAIYVNVYRRNVGTMLVSAAPPEKQELKLAKTMVESSRLVPGVDRTTPRSF